MKALATVLMVLVRPRLAFRRLADGQRKVWLAALALLIAATLIQVTVSIPHAIELQNKVLREQGLIVDGEDDGGRGEEPGEGVAQGPILSEETQKTLETAAVISAYVFGPLGLVATALFVAALLLVASKALGGEGTYAPAFSMYVMATMPGAVRALIQSAYAAVTGKWIQNQGLSALVATESSVMAPTPLYALLSVIDIYFIWQLVLLALGLTVVLQVPKRRALIIVAAYAVLTFVVTVVPVVISSALTPAAIGG